VPPVLCVVGDLVEDVVVWSARAVVTGTDNPCVVRRTRGGSAANVAALAAPHVRTRFVGCVGEDAAGDALERALAATGVEVCLQRRDRTGSVVVIVDPTGERTMFPDRAAAAQMSTDAVRWVDDVDRRTGSAAAPRPTP
jgi:sugar/nucleoside kinase (ribokinase family)